LAVFHLVALVTTMAALFALKQVVQILKIALFSLPAYLALCHSANRQFNTTA